MKNVASLNKNNQTTLQWDRVDGFSLISVIIDYTGYFKSHFTEKIWLRNYSQ